MVWAAFAWRREFCAPKILPSPERTEERWEGIRLPPPLKASRGRSFGIPTTNGARGRNRKQKRPKWQAPGNYALRLPASLKRPPEAVAREEGTTIDQFILSAVPEKLSALEIADYAARGRIDERRSGL